MLRVLSYLFFTSAHKYGQIINLPYEISLFPSCYGESGRFIYSFRYQLITKNYTPISK